MNSWTGKFFFLYSREKYYFANTSTTLARRIDTACGIANALLTIVPHAGLTNYCISRFTLFAFLPSRMISTILNYDIARKYYIVNAAWCNFRYSIIPNSVLFRDRIRSNAHCSHMARKNPNTNYLFDNNRENILDTIIRDDQVDIDIPRLRKRADNQCFLFLRSPWWRFVTWTVYCLPIQFTRVLHVFRECNNYLGCRKKDLRNFFGFCSIWCFNDYHGQMAQSHEEMLSIDDLSIFTLPILFA